MIWSTTRLFTTATVIASIALSGCGGGESNEQPNQKLPAPTVPADAPPTTPAPSTGGAGAANPGTSTPAVPSTPLAVGNIEFAQTHVLPSAGLSWTTANDSHSLHLVGGRAAFFAAAIGQNDVVMPVVEAWKDGARLGSISLSPPSSLPATEASAIRYASDRWSASVPAAYIVPGISFRITASNYASSPETVPLVGLDSELEVSVIPFYLFGANETNTFPYSVTSAPTLAQQSELHAVLPVSKVKANAPARIDWPSMVIPPRDDKNGFPQPAYVITAIEQQKEGYAVMAAALELLEDIKAANGDGPMNYQYYGPILTVSTATGKFRSIGGGLGAVGGGASVGDHKFAGTMLHEMGHGFGLHHAGQAFTDGEYPYLTGSLKGSVWGFDASLNTFIDTLISPNASNFSGCSTKRELNQAGACIKQDPMQGGSGDQPVGKSYTMFSDFNTGKIQRWFEGVTTNDAAGNSVYTSGRIFLDPAGTYSRWDSTARKRVPVSATFTSNKGLYASINQGLPGQRNVPVHTIAVTRSAAGTVGATHVYPAVTRTGNLIKMFDPTNAQDRLDITPNTGVYSKYCLSSGCDYSVRVTYSDGSIVYRVRRV